MLCRTLLLYNVRARLVGLFALHSLGDLWHSDFSRFFFRTYPPYTHRYMGQRCGADFFNTNLYEIDKNPAT